MTNLDNVYDHCYVIISQLLFIYIMSVEDALLCSIGYVRLRYRSDVYIIQYNWSERQWHYTILFRMTSVGDLTVKSADSLTSAVLTCAHCWLTFRQSHSIRSSPIRHEILPVCAFCFTSSLWETIAQLREQILLHLGRDADDRERMQNSSLSFDNLPRGPRPKAVVQVAGYSPQATL